METLTGNELLPVRATQEIITTSSNAFIMGNTIEMHQQELRDVHIIPVFPVTNEPLISHSQLIDVVGEAVYRQYPLEQILLPAVRVSHPVKGRIPEAKNKRAAELHPWEETLYYERMMFLIEIPSIRTKVGENELALTIGAVKAYNLDSIYSKKKTHLQQFKLFIGFQNKVCCNLCVSTDGYKIELNITNLSQLRFAVESILRSFVISREIETLSRLTNNGVSESQFAHIIGRTRLYKFLPEGYKNEIVPILLGDQQLGAVAKGYYNDSHFSREHDGSISLWKMHNLLTGANKSSYIDNFLERSVNASMFVNEISEAVTGIKSSWYLK